MKKIFIYSLAALALASCGDDEFLGASHKDNPKTDGAIMFSPTRSVMTRGESNGATAAEKLNNNFIVYGFKYYGTEPTAAGTASGQVGDPASQQKVFDLYNVNYTEGTDNTTESNTKGWEYVGYTSIGGADQTIKYWDYATTGYVFSAVSGTGITAEKIESVANGAAADGDPVTPMAWSAPTLTREEGANADEYDKGWVVTIPQGGSLSDLYASERVEKLKANYNSVVNLKFYNLGAKIRFAMYETVPGYSIQIKKFYYTNSGEQNSETNFAIDAENNFTTLSTTPGTPTKLIVTYYNSGTLVNRPKVTPLNGTVNTAAYGLFGTNVQPTTEIGTTSAMATYDQADKSYTDIIPGNGGKLTLKVDYTLTSTDGTDETINVKGATAIVPANFTEWKANFAYTYLFKISDNTNGNTGTAGTDPAGLYPITFDAVVVGNEDGIQETITSVSDPSITTYQMGKVVTANDEYVAGNAGDVLKDIYFENGTADISNYHVYEVNNYGTEATTEEVVANWKNNFCVLTEVTITKSTGTAQDFIPLSDGSYIKKGANQAAHFKPYAGKTYVISDAALDAATAPVTPAHYKVVKVAGTVAAAPNYTQDMTTATIDAPTAKAVYSLKSNSPAANTVVLGAAPCLKIFKGTEDVTTNFTITDKADGTYEIELTTAAIAAGANGTYTVKFNNVACSTNLVVNLTYNLTTSPITVVAGNSNTFTLTVNTAALHEAVIDCSESGITIKETSTAGTYQVSVAADKAHGSYSATVAGVALTINVDTYAFTSNPVITMAQTGTSTAFLVLQKNGADDNSIAYTALTGGNDAVATGTEDANTDSYHDGKYTLTAVAGGQFTLTYENAKATVTVNQYTFTAANANIAANTGSTTLTLEKNNGTRTIENASTTKVTVKKDGVAAAAGTYKLTTNGQKLTFSNVSAPGVYTFEYTENSVVVATAKVTVGEALTASAASISIVASETSILTYHNAAGVATAGMTPSVASGTSGTDWTITDNSDGTYTFTGLVAGTYVVTIGGKNVTITVTA